MRQNILSIKMIFGAVLIATLVSGTAFCQKQKITKYFLQEEQLYKNINRVTINNNGVNNSFYQTNGQVNQSELKMNNQDDKTKNIHISNTLPAELHTQKREFTSDALKINSSLSPFEKMGFGETRANDVNIKAVRDFVKNFKNVESNKWSLTEDGSSTSTFNSNGINTTAVYNRKGYRIYILRVYEEDKMSFDIRHMVRRQYYDATITLVKEFETAKGLTIYVHMKDKETWKVVRVANGVMQLIENFNKG